MIALRELWRFRQLYSTALLVKLRRHSLITERYFKRWYPFDLDALKELHRIYYPADQAANAA